MIIDFHTHIFPDVIAEKTISNLSLKSGFVPYTNGTELGLINNMENASIDIAVSLPVLTKPSQFDSVFNFALSVNEKYLNVDRKIISFAGMHPEIKDIEEKMALIKKSGLKGVKIHPDYQGTPIDNEGYIRILKSAKKNDLIVVTHAGVDDGFKGYPVMCPPDKVRKVIEMVNHPKFVLAHYGGNRQWEEVYEIIAGLNVYLDTAYTFNNIDKQIFLKILSKHGDDKVLFATDCPWQDMKYSVEFLRSLNVSEQSLNKILYKNASELLNL